MVSGVTRNSKALSWLLYCHCPSKGQRERKRDRERGKKRAPSYSATSLDLPTCLTTTPTEAHQMTIDHVKTCIRIRTSGSQMFTGRELDQRLGRRCTQQHLPADLWTLLLLYLERLCPFSRAVDWMRVTSPCLQSFLSISLQLKHFPNYFYSSKKVNCPRRKSEH